MRNKYFILVLTFLSLLISQSGYTQDWQDMWDDTEDGTNSHWESNDDGGFTETDFDYGNLEHYETNMDDQEYNDWLDSGGWEDKKDHSQDDMKDPHNQTNDHYVDNIRYNDDDDDTHIYDGLLDTHNYDNDTNPYDDDQYPPGDTPNNDNNGTPQDPTTEEPPVKRIWYLDNDGDEYYETYTFAVNKPSGNYKAFGIGFDCDDTDALKNISTDCGWKKWYLDEDHDGYHSDETEQTDRPDGEWVLTTKGVDCEESAPTITDQCRRKMWYLDWDGDRYHSDEMLTGDYPGEGWILTTKGDDCNDEDPTITTQCRPSTCKNCPEVVNEVAIVDIILPDNTAQYGYVDAEGNVHIKSEDGTYKKPSQLNPNSDVDRTALHQIAASLARSLDGLNKNISIRSADSDQLSSENPAFTRTPPGTWIFLNSKGGFSADLDNVNNFKSIIKHEIFHVDDEIYKKNHPNFVPKNDLESHADVYIKAANDPTYKNTTLDFKNGNTGSFANYLLNMDKSSDATITRDVIAKKIAAFNEASADIKVRIADYYSQKGGLKLKLEIKGKLTNYIKMTPVDN